MSMNHERCGDCTFFNPPNINTSHLGACINPDCSVGFTFSTRSPNEAHPAEYLNPDKDPCKHITQGLPCFRKDLRETYRKLFLQALFRKVEAIKSSKEIPGINPNK